MAFDDDRKHLAKGWDATEEIANKSGMWIKLDPGETIELNVASEPEAFEKTFDQPGGEKKVTTRFSVDVFVPGQGLRTWEMSKTTFNDLKRQKQKRGAEFPNAIFSVERIGSGTSTKYALDYERQLKERELDERNSLLIKAGINPNDIPF